jgi:broad specificity phosphatase PhoE
MTNVYFIRHAQAGSRDNYDILSDLGREQATLLGRHLGSQGVRLAAVYSGTMQRHVTTASLVCEALATGEHTVPELVADAGWNEFSLAGVYARLLPRLREANSSFARDYAEMQEILAREPHAVGGAVARCDLAVINAWIECRFAGYDGESWADFKSRILSRIGGLTRHNSGEAIAVFTSATPIAILTGVAMGLSDEGIISVGGVLFNSGITTMMIRNEKLRLLTLNATPHLPDARRTFR